MRKLFIFTLASLLYLFGCHEDKGNYDYTALPEFLVDTAGAQKTFTITQFETLALPSRLKYAGDKSKLTYSWSIYRSGGSTSTIPTEILSATENLNAEIRVSPGSYLLEFCATETTSGIRAMMQYAVTVEGAIGNGLLVFYEKASGTDCDLVKDSLFDATLVSETILRGIYSMANPERPLNGKPVACALTNTNASKHIYLFTESDGVKLYTDDMTVMTEFPAMFFSAPEICKPQGIYGGSMERFFNNGKLHTCLVTWSGTMAPRFELGKVGADYEAAPYMLATYGENTLFYDNKNTRFLFSTMYGSTAVVFTAQGDAFAFDNVGKKMIYMNNGYGTKPRYTGYCIMRDEPDNNARYIYPVDVSVSSYNSYAALPVLDISACPGIASAEHFAFGVTGPIVFYAVANKLYQINYDWSTATVSGSTEVWNFGNEEVSMLKKYRDSIYLVATYNAGTGEGKLYALEADIASGRLTPAPLEVFGGFGKVKDVVYKNI